MTSLEDAMIHFGLFLGLALVMGVKRAR